VLSVMSSDNVQSSHGPSGAVRIRESASKIEMKSHALMFALGAASVAALLAVLGASSTGPQNPPVDPVLHDTFPEPGDLQLLGAEKGSVLLRTNAPEVEGRLTYDTTTRRIDIAWLYEVSGLIDGDLLSDPTKARSRQSLALEFWPTEVISAGPLRIVAAGLNGRGNHLLQVIELEPLERLPSLAIDPTTSEKRIPNVQLEVASRETPLRSAVGAGRFIGHMWWNRGAADRVFVQYQDTREVCEVDLTTGDVVKQVAVKPGTAGADPSALVVPDLARFHLAAGDGDHIAKGYVYWLYSPNATTGTYVLLEDTDRDGVIDQASSRTDWPSEFATFTNYASLR